MGSAQAAADLPANLGSGLGEVAARSIAANAPGSKLARQRQLSAIVEPEMLVIESDSLMRDAAGRVMVNVLVRGTAKHADVQASFKSLNGASITAVDKNYRSGVIEGYVPESMLATLAKMPGVSAVHGVHRPVTNVGAVTQQGVGLHRVDQIPQYDGTGITVGVLSDSYNLATTFASGAALTVHEAQDIVSGDLPGAGNPAGNTQPVVVLEDATGGLDEGRAMAQLIHDMAPKARLGFATAFSGQVGFANNIRALAGIQGLPNSRLDFAAQIIVDDVQYFAEGMFADTIIAQAVDDVTALGVSYFSSAGNTPPTQGYASDLRIVPVGPNATAGTNINLTGVPAALYAGGFHNFRSDGGQDIAQTMNLGSVAGRRLTLVMQWDDPYDVIAPVLGALVINQPGSITAGGSFDATFNNPTVGKQYQIDVQGDSPINGPGLFDAIVTLIQPDGSTLAQVDTGNGEVFTINMPQAGTYTVRVTGFNNDTGTFAVKVNETSAVPLMTSDFNLLFFHPTTGAYGGCICENNLATNRPIELATIRLPSTFNGGLAQMVIARANNPVAAIPASRLRYKMLSSSADGTTGSPAEYFSYSTPITYGHNSAAGANGVAAYSPFQPAIPEDFTSTGPVRIVWDRNNQRIPEAQQVRLKPNLAAMDGGNTTFFTSDTSRDLDTFFNFFGTSAAAPTAASIAALVLQAKGGPGTVTPAQMRTILQNSAFPHDLDPYSAKGSSTAAPNRGKVTISLDGDNSATARTDPNAFTVSYTGPSSITSITFDATTANPNGGNVVNTSTPGLVFDVRAAPTGQPFVLGSSSAGLTAGSVAATFSNQAPAPSVANMFFTMNLAITPGTFTGGKTLRFGVSRDTFRSAFAPGLNGGDSRTANSADLAGSLTRLPAGTTAVGGITYTGTLADGSTFSGTLANRIGAGYSFLDGFGFINAQTAVAMPLP
jgi:hypothetical protein